MRAYTSFIMVPISVEELADRDDTAGPLWGAFTELQGVGLSGYGTSPEEAISELESEFNKARTEVR